MKINTVNINRRELKDASYINIVEENEIYIIQEYHLSIYYILCLGIENEMFGEE